MGVAVTGNIGVPRVLFNLTLRAWESVDFSNRHPRLAKNRRHGTWPCLTEPCYMNSWWTNGEVVLLGSTDGPRLGPRLAAGCRSAWEGCGHGVVTITVHYWTTTKNKHWGGDSFLKIFEFRDVLVSRTFVFGQPEPSTHRKQERMKENTSQMFFPSLCASRRHLKLFSKSQTISDGIYHVDVLCPLM